MQPESEPLELLGFLFDRALRRLGDAGEDDAAARLAAEGWWLLRGPVPVVARRLNATLHYLTLRPSSTGAALPDSEPETDERKEDRCPPELTRSSTCAASRRPAATS